MTVPAEPVFTTRATPCPLEQAPGTMVGGVTAPGSTVAETVRLTVVAGGVCTQLFVPLFTHTDTGSRGTATGPTVAVTVVASATAGPAAARTPMRAGAATRERRKRALVAIMKDPFFW
jgi:hypothetical protein